MKNLIQSSTKWSNSTVLSLCALSLSLFFLIFFSDTHDVLHALTFNIILQSYSGPSMACSSTHVPFHFKIQTIPYYIMFFSIEFNHSPYLPSMPPFRHHILLPSHPIQFNSSSHHSLPFHLITPTILPHLFRSPAPPTPIHSTQCPLNLLHSFRPLTPLSQYGSIQIIRVYLMWPFLWLCPRDVPCERHPRKIQKHRFLEYECQ